MRWALALVAALGACGASGEQASMDSKDDGVTIPSDIVEREHLRELNAWIREQDDRRPPAPSVGRPTGFTAAQCDERRPNEYSCRYSYLDGGVRQDVTKTFQKTPSGSWRMTTTN